MAYSDSLVDKRVVKRNIGKGLVDAKELDKQTKALVDRADNVETVSIDDDNDIDNDIDDNDDEMESAVTTVTNPLATNE